MPFDSFSRWRQFITIYMGRQYMPSSHWLKVSEKDISAYIVASDNICILVTICAVNLYIYCRRRQSVQDDNICRNTSTVYYVWKLSITAKTSD